MSRISTDTTVTPHVSVFCTSSALISSSRALRRVLNSAISMLPIASRKVV